MYVRDFFPIPFPKQIPNYQKFCLLLLEGETILCLTSEHRLKHVFFSRTLTSSVQLQMFFQTFTVISGSHNAQITKCAQYFWTMYEIFQRKCRLSFCQINTFLEQLSFDNCINNTILGAVSVTFVAPIQQRQLQAKRNIASVQIFPSNIQVSLSLVFLIFLSFSFCLFCFCLSFLSFCHSV